MPDFAGENARLRAALEELRKEYRGAGMADDKRKVTYKWSLSIIEAALAAKETHGTD